MAASRTGSRYYTFVKPIITNKVVKNYSFITFSIITSIIFIVFAIQPTVKTIISLQKSIEEQKSVLAAAVTKSEALGAGESNYEKIPATTKDNLETMIPDYPTLPQFVADISSLVAEKEATVSGLQFQPTELPILNKKASSSLELTNIEFTLNVQGSYPSLLEILDQLANFNHFVSISTINLSKPTEGSVIMTVNGKTYFMKN